MPLQFLPALDTLNRPEAPPCPCAADHVPGVPCGLPADDWNLLFAAVMQRLRVEVLGRPAGAATADQALQDCLLSLQLLYVALCAERAGQSVR